MKRKLWIILVLFFLPVLCHEAAMAEKSGSCGENLTWTLNNEGVLTISGTGDMQNFHFLESNAPWQEDRASIRSVVIEEGVTSIGYRAFELCDSIVSVEIPDTVTYIYDVAFYNCSSLTDITIPSDVTDIGQNAFYNCDSLTEIFLPASVANIQRGAFSSCSSLLSITVDGENEVYSSIDGILYDKEVHTMITCPAGRNGSFTVLDSVNRINEGAFAECAGLTEIVLPESVNFIDASAFYKCSGLTDLIIPDSVSYIPLWAFQYCDNLRIISIPINVTNIDRNAFEGCDKLADVYYSGTEEQWNSIVIGSQNDPLNSASIHYNYEVIASGSCGENLTWILDSDGVLTISGSGEMASYSYSEIQAPWRSYASSLKSTVIEDGVTSISAYAFFRCACLETLSMPDSMSIIGPSAFDDCTSLNDVTIPAGVSSIDGFAFRKCSSLSGFTVNPDNPFYTSLDGVLFNYTQTKLVCYPAGKTDSTYIIPETVTGFDIGAFHDCTHLTSVTIPTGVKSLSLAQFSGCSSLVSIVIPATVTSIAPSVFQDCTSLTDVYYTGTEDQWNAISILMSNEPLDSAVIHFNYGQTDLRLPAGTLTIESKAFAGIRSGLTVYIPATVVSIADDAFPEGIIIVTPAGSYADTWASALGYTVLHQP